MYIYDHKDKSDKQNGVASYRYLRIEILDLGEVTKRQRTRPAYTHFSCKLLNTPINH